MPDVSAVTALAAGKAFVDLSHWRKLDVSGDDVLGWLDGVVGADLGALAPGVAVPVEIADGDGGPGTPVVVAVVGGRILLLQDPDVAPSMDGLVAERAAAAGVVVDDRSHDLALFAFPNRDHAPAGPGAVESTPSCLGPGTDLVALAADGERLRRTFAKVCIEAGPDDVRAWQAAGEEPVAASP